MAFMQASQLLTYTDNKEYSLSFLTSYSLPIIICILLYALYFSIFIYFCAIYRKVLRNVIQKNKPIFFDLVAFLLRYRKI